MRSIPYLEPDQFKGVLGPSLAGKRPKTETEIYILISCCKSQSGKYVDLTTARLNHLAVLKIIFYFVLAPPPPPHPPPPGVPGEGPDCHFPKVIVGFGFIPARIRGFLIFMLSLSTARTTARLNQVVVLEGLFHGPVLQAARLIGFFLRRWGRTPQIGLIRSLLRPFGA